MGLLLVIIIGLVLLFMQYSFFGLLFTLGFNVIIIVCLILVGRYA